MRIKVLEKNIPYSWKHIRNNGVPVYWNRLFQLWIFVLVTPTILLYWTEINILLPSRMGIVLFLIIFLIINLARFAQIRVLSTILNFFRKEKKITKNFQYVLIYSGFRGAMGKQSHKVTLYEYNFTSILSVCFGDQRKPSVY